MDSDVKCVNSQKSKAKIDVNYTLMFATRDAQDDKLDVNLLQNFPKDFSYINCAINQTREMLFTMISFEFYALSLNKRKNISAVLKTKKKKSNENRISRQFFS